MSVGFGCRSYDLYYVFTQLKIQRLLTGCKWDARFISILWKKGNLCKLARKYRFLNTSLFPFSKSEQRKTRNHESSAFVFLQFCSDLGCARPSRINNERARNYAFVAYMYLYGHFLYFLAWGCGRAVLGLTVARGNAMSHHPYDSTL